MKRGHVQAARVGEVGAGARSRGWARKRGLGETNTGKGAEGVGGPESSLSAGCSRNAGPARLIMGRRAGVRTRRDAGLLIINS